MKITFDKKMIHELIRNYLHCKYKINKNSIEINREGEGLVADFRAGW